MTFGQKEEFKGFCEIYGLPLLADGSCKKYHVKKLPKRGRYSGKSKTPYGEYENR